MAVELCSSENLAGGMSPRISFSLDFCQSEAIPVEQRLPLRSNSTGSNSCVAFDFCVRDSFDHESSSADELFSDGKILPTEIKKKSAPAKSLFPHGHPPLQEPRGFPPSNSKHLKREGLKEIRNAQNENEEKQGSKSFWPFKRSSSCGTGYGHSLCPLPLLSRSYSTGSSPSSVKRSATVAKENGSKNRATKSSSSQTHGFQRPPLKKAHGSSYGNGVQITPILNVPSRNLFGFGSIFSSNKDKTKKR